MPFIGKNASWDPQREEASEATVSHNLRNLASAQAWSKDDESMKDIGCRTDNILRVLL